MQKSKIWFPRFPNLYTSLHLYISRYIVNVDLESLFCKHVISLLLNEFNKLNNTRAQM